MRNLSKWTMLVCALLVSLSPIAATAHIAETETAEPIETGKQYRELITFSMPVVPIKAESKVRILSASPEPTPEPTPTPKPKAEPLIESKPKEEEKPEGRSVTFEATAYTIGKGQVPNLKGITATGTKVKEGRTLSVDPRDIPLGSLVYIESEHPGVTGYYVAEDTGSAVKGKKMDVFYGWGGKGTPDHKAALQFGRRDVQVTVVKEGNYAETGTIDEEYLRKAEES